MFTGLRSLYSLDVDNNNVTALFDGTFLELPELTRLSLQSNLIELIQEETFTNSLPKLSDLDMSG